MVPFVPSVHRVRLMPESSKCRVMVSNGVEWWWSLEMEASVDVVWILSCKENYLGMSFTGVLLRCVLYGGAVLANCCGVRWWHTWKTENEEWKKNWRLPSDGADQISGFAQLKGGEGGHYLWCVRRQCKLLILISTLRLARNYYVPGTIRIQLRLFTR